MRNETIVSRWGNSLAVRIPRAVSRQAGIDEGDSLALDIKEDGAIILRPTKRRYELKDLVSRITPRNRHKETDWGAPQGRETW
jgi:antitoxin MazE